MATHGRIQSRSGASLSSVWKPPQASLTPPDIVFGNPFSTDSSRASLNLMIPSPGSHPGRRSSGRLPRLFGPLFIYATTIPSKFLGQPPSSSPPTTRTPVPIHSLPSRTSPLALPNMHVPPCGSPFGFSFPHFLITKIILESMPLGKDAKETEWREGENGSPPTSPTTSPLPSSLCSLHTGPYKNYLPTSFISGHLHTH